VFDIVMLTLHRKTFLAKLIYKKITICKFFIDKKIMVKYAFLHETKN
jgi:hypothetical protein